MSSPAPVDTASPEAAPVLADLIAAGLVSHEMIGDPAQLGPEAEVLRALCGLVAGPVWRIEAVPLRLPRRPGDLGGRLGGRSSPRGWTAALEAALQAALGADAVWLNATDLLPDAGAGLEQPLLVLRAHAEAVAGGDRGGGPGLQAVIGARFAADCARLIAGAEPGGALDARLGALEARQAEMLTALEAQAATGAALARLTETLAVALQRLDAQAEVLHTHIAHEDMVAGRLTELAALAGTPALFQETLGVTLAEFLARLERRSEEPAAPGPRAAVQLSREMRHGPERDRARARSRPPKTVPGARARRSPPASPSATACAALRAERLARLHPGRRRRRWPRPARAPDRAGQRRGAGRARALPAAR